MPLQQLERACADAENMIYTIALHVTNPMLEVEEFFFHIPKASRVVLEYMG